MKRRSGFTLTELLIVIGILLIMSTMALAVFGTNRSSDKMRSAARVAQSAFLGAKDRAMHAKDFRGVRMTRDQNGPQFANGIPCLVSGFAFTQPIPLQTYAQGTVDFERYDMDQNKSADSAQIAVVRGLSANWAQLATSSSIFPNPGQIRIPATTGQWYQFFAQTTGTGPYVLSATNQVLQLASPYQGAFTVPFANAGTVPNANDVVAVPASNSSATCDIQFGNDVLPFHQPIPLPSGVVIDLRYSSTNIQFLAGTGFATGSIAPNIDISFSPRGSVQGAVGGLGSLSLCLRTLEDATASSSINITTPPSPRDPSDPACTGECLVVTVNPATGLVQTYPANLTDAFNNATGASGADGIVDNLFSFAQQGKAAGR
jgi:prepilin-type N-terminal cleavage/methylation domain-containing protein